ncbi:hypothetical protein HF086_008151 [Spodoptera exigua]|uniref:Uncharacterized protein n=1 Tax=Spodoptera exigua TaxID=7107 RepID=A0A922M3D6_SPOEX|nr:hypothetical protein HF086_008151 [Spodoptera exigua]
MPTTRKGEALRKQRGEDEGDVTLTEEESVAERGHVDDAARAGSRPTSQPAPQIPTDFLSTLIETITRAQVEANRSLINTLMTSSGDFRASTPVGISSSNATSADFCTEVEYNSYASPSDIDSCVNITNISTRDNHPMVNISVAGRGGVAIIDTGATHSIASPLLHRVLVDSGVHFTETKRFVRLADGSQGWRDLLSAEVEVSIKGRRVTCQFLVLPGSDIRTLLGIDFLTRAGMVIDVARRTWSFSDSPGQPYDFVYTYTLDSADTGLLHTTSSSELSLRSDEGCKLNSEQRRALNAFIEERAPQFAREGPATEFAAHRIKVSPQQEPIACPPYLTRMRGPPSAARTPRAPTQAEVARAAARESAPTLVAYGRHAYSSATRRHFNNNVTMCLNLRTIDVCV